MNDKIREVALRVARDMPEFLWAEGCDHECGVLDHEAVEFLTRCLQELSKDVEPVAWQGVSGNLVYDLKSLMPNARHLAKPLYLHPPLTEQDKLDAARYRCIRGIKHLESFVALNQLDYSSDEEFDTAIDRAMEHEK